MQNSFSVPKQPRDAALAGHTQHTLLDKINHMIIDGDTHYSKFKFDRHSNFKHGIVNTLGIYENVNFFSKQLGQLAMIGCMYSDKTDINI